MTHIKKLSLARTVAVAKQPYVATMLYALTPIEVKETKTMFVTPGLVLGYNPAFVNGLPTEQLAGVYLHEANHPLREHHNRLRDATHAKLRNIAFDIPINDDLENAGVALPRNRVASSTYELPQGLTSERYYLLLLEKMQQGESFGDGEPDVTAGSCGGGAGNPADEDLERELDAKYGRSAAEVSVKRAETLREASRHLRGSLPSELAEMVKALTAPSKVPWRTALRNTVQVEAALAVAGDYEYSMRRISRRSYADDSDILRPGLIDGRPDVLVAIDTSASMRNEHLAASLREVIAILQNTNGSRVRLLEVDAAIAHPVREVGAHDLANIALHGRGGTDFRPAFSLIQQMRRKPSLVVYCTDGYGPAPEKPPRHIKVVWCLLNKRCSVPAKWGKPIYMEDVE